MNKIWFDEALEEYKSWKTANPKIQKRIKRLISDIEINGPKKGIGKPEKLSYEDGYSRRIDDKNRLIYTVDSEDNLYIVSCKGHYDDK